MVKQQTPSWAVNGGKKYIYVYMSENLSSFFLKSGSLEAFVCIYDTLLENRVVNLVLIVLCLHRNILLYVASLCEAFKCNH